MTVKQIRSDALCYLHTGLATIALFQMTFGASLVHAAPADNPDIRVQTPIKHVIVIVGENRSFDHVFATYVPRT
jgi:phospholipase C